MRGRRLEDDIDHVAEGYVLYATLHEPAARGRETHASRPGGTAQPLRCPDTVSTITAGVGRSSRSSRTASLPNIGFATQSCLLNKVPSGWTRGGGTFQTPPGGCHVHRSPLPSQDPGGSPRGSLLEGVVAGQAGVAEGIVTLSSALDRQPRHHTA